VLLNGSGGWYSSTTKVNSSHQSRFHRNSDHTGDIADFELLHDWVSMGFSSAHRDVQFIGQHFSRAAHGNESQDFALAIRQIVNECWFGARLYFWSFKCQGLHNISRKVASAASYALTASISSSGCAFFDKSALTLRRIIFLINCWFKCIVSKTNFCSGILALTSVISSCPFKWGISRSVKTTSGFSSRIAVRALRGSVYEPTMDSPHELEFP